MTGTKKQKYKALQMKLTATSLILLLFALAFNAMLSLNDLEKRYADALISKCITTGQDLQQSLTKAIKFGKKINNFVNMDRLLNSSREELIKGNFFIQDETRDPGESDLKIFITGLNDIILYSLDKKDQGQTFSHQELDKKKSIALKHPNPGKKTFKVKKNGSEYIIILPVETPLDGTVAFIHIAFDEHRIKDAFKAVLNQSIALIAFLIISWGLLLLFLIKRVIKGMSQMSVPDKFPRKKIFFLIFSIIGTVQVIFTLVNLTMVKNSFVEINNDKAITTISPLRNDVQYLLKKGIRLDKLNKIDERLVQITSTSPELGTIAISLPDTTILYSAKKNISFDYTSTGDTTGPGRGQTRLHLDQLSAEYRIAMPLTVKGEPSGLLEAEISRSYLFSSIREIALDAVTVLVISILFLFDMLLLVFIFVQKDMQERTDPQEIHYGLMRPAAFIFLFGINVSISFLPLHMADLYMPILGLSKDMVMGLPISMEVTCAGIAIIFAGTWLDKRGWHEPFLIGLLLVGGGFFYSATAPDAINFILSRAVVGLGYGLTLMAGQGFVIGCTDKESNAKGLAQFFAGVYAGNICGGAAGAMIAERFGYKPVFMIGAIASLSVIGYAFLFLRDAMKKPEIPKAARLTPITPRADQGEPTSKLTLFVKFLFNRNILGLVLFSNIPYALAVVGFLNYFCPVYLNGIGSSQSNIGRVYIIYGVCLIYVAPFLVKFIKSSREKQSLVLSGILGGMGFLIFQVFDGMLAVGIAVFALGLSGSFGAPRRSYILKFKATHDLGDGTSMGVFLSTIRIGQMLGPFLFGGLIMTVGISKGITYFGLAYLIATGLFFLMVDKDQSIEEKESEGELTP